MGLELARAGGTQWGARGKAVQVDDIRLTLG